MFKHIGQGNNKNCCLIKHTKGEFYMPQGATETSTLKVGDQAPDFTLGAHGNRRITLSEYRGTKNVFLCFYPLDWTPV
jgi:peroxiredoxin